MNISDADRARFIVKEMEARLNPVKTEDLKKAENSYIVFCRSLGFEGKASTEEREAVYQNIKQQDPALASEIAIKALALINNVMQNGGNWFGIEWHEGIA